MREYLKVLGFIFNTHINSRNFCRAVLSEDENSCFSIDNGLRRDCFVRIAKAKSDANICHEIEDRESCFAEIVMNCDMIKDNIEEKDDCFYGQAVENKNPDGCDNIKSLSLRNLCYYEIVNRIAKGI